VKVSVSLPDDDVTFLDEYAARAGTGSRSAVVHQAIALLRSTGLEQDYAQAWDEWEAGGNARLWDSTATDGIGDAAR
jgi:Arc/MetJ-type ribon-helix-helix transcriptional regulator